MYMFNILNNPVISNANNLPENSQIKFTFPKLKYIDIGIGIRIKIDNNEDF